MADASGRRKGREDVVPAHTMGICAVAEVTLASSQLRHQMEVNDQLQAQSVSRPLGTEEKARCCSNKRIDFTFQKISILKGVRVPTLSYFDSSYSYALLWWLRYFT